MGIMLGISPKNPNVLLKYLGGLQMLEKIMSVGVVNQYFLLFISYSKLCMLFFFMQPLYVRDSCERKLRIYS